MDRKLVDEVFKAIVRINLGEAKDAIPDSVLFPHLMLSQHGIEKATLVEIISILNEAHKIFVFEIQHSANPKAERIEGYIDADITTIHRLILTYGETLANYYEDRYHKKISPQTIIKELMASMGLILGSEIGTIANKFIMFNEYEKLLQKQYDEYSEEWKERKLTEIIEQRKARNLPFENEVLNYIETTDSAAEFEYEQTQTENIQEYEEYDPKKGNIPVEKLLNIYGIEFFIKVYFKKYDFAFIEKIIKAKIINKKDELKLVKKMLEAIKINIGFDKNLSNHIIELHRLERVIDQYLVM